MEIADITHESLGFNHSLSNIQSFCTEAQESPSPQKEASLSETISTWFNASICTTLIFGLRKLSGDAGSDASLESTRWSVTAVSYHDPLPACGHEDLLPSLIGFAPDSSSSTDYQSAHYNWRSSPPLRGHIVQDSKDRLDPTLELDQDQIQAGTKVNIRIFLKTGLARFGIGNGKEILKLKYPNTFKWCGMRFDDWINDTLTLDLIFNFPVDRHQLQQHLRLLIGSKAKAFEWVGPERSREPRLKLRVSASEMNQQLHLQLSPMLRAASSKAKLKQKVSLSKPLQPIRDRRKIAIPIPPRFWDRKLYKKEFCEEERSEPEPYRPQICFYGPYKVREGNEFAAENALIKLLCQDRRPYFPQFKRCIDDPD